MPVKFLVAWIGKLFGGSKTDQSHVNVATSHELPWVIIPPATLQTQMIVSAAQSVVESGSANHSVIRGSECKGNMFAPGANNMIY